MACGGWHGPRKTPRRGAGLPSRRPGRACAWSAIRPATCGRARTRTRPGGRSGRILTACAGAVGSMARSAWRADSSSRPTPRDRWRWCRSPTRRARASTRPRSGARRWRAGSISAAVLERSDDDGVSLREAMAAAGVDPDGVALAPGWVQKLAGFLEIHIDQTTELARAAEPVGWSPRWPRGCAWRWF